MTIKQKTLWLVTMMGLALLPQPGWAIFPVFDAVSIGKLIQQINQLRQQYTLLHISYETAREQLTQTKKLLNNSEGHYGFGQLLNNTLDSVQRYKGDSPMLWRVALHPFSDPEKQYKSSTYKKFLQDYRKQHTILSEKMYQKGTDAIQAKHYHQQVGVNRTVISQAAYTFDRLKDYLSTIHQLSKHIDQTPNTKAALDLNARLLTEMAYLQIQNLKMQVLLLQQQASGQAWRIDQSTQSAQFNTIPDAIREENL